MKLQFKKMASRAQNPKLGSEHAAGFDLVAITKSVKHLPSAPSRISYGTGIAVAIPPGYVGLLFPRSSVSKTGLRLANSVGVIDADYRGEIFAVFDKRDHGDEYEIGDRVAQLVVVPAPFNELEEVEELSDTERGDGGFGSTGK